MWHLKFVSVSFTSANLLSSTAWLIQNSSAQNSLAEYLSSSRPTFPAIYLLYSDFRLLCALCFQNRLNWVTQHNASHICHLVLRLKFFDKLIISLVNFKNVFICHFFPLILFFLIFCSTRFESYFRVKFCAYKVILSKLKWRHECYTHLMNILNILLYPSLRFGLCLGHQIFSWKCVDCLLLWTVSN